MFLHNSVTPMRGSAQSHFSARYLAPRTSKLCSPCGHFLSVKTAGGETLFLPRKTKRLNLAATSPLFAVWVVSLSCSTSTSEVSLLFLTGFDCRLCGRRRQEQQQQVSQHLEVGKWRQTAIWASASMPLRPEQQDQLALPTV